MTVTAEIDDVIAKVQTYMKALSGMRDATENPPDQINVFPFAVCLPMTGSMGMQDASGDKELHRINIDIHIARKDAPRDYQKFVPFIRSVKDTLFRNFRASKWGGIVDAIGTIDYATTTFDYGGTETVGLRFTVNDIKMIVAAAT